MSAGDFRSNERSVTLTAPTVARIEHTDANGQVTVLKEELPLQAGEVLDATYMSRAALVDFLAAQVKDAQKKDVLFSIHMKATMMKVSDPIIFGHAVRVFFGDVFQKHGALLDRIGANPNNGLESVLNKVAELDDDDRAAVEAGVRAAYESGPAIAMVNSDKGITNLHVPSDVIIDASIPPLVRDAGRMWNAEGELQDAKVVQSTQGYPIRTRTIDLNNP